jgi:hypothetical protein
MMTESSPISKSAFTREQSELGLAHFEGRGWRGFRPPDGSPRRERLWKCRRRRSGLPLTSSFFSPCLVSGHDPPGVRSGRWKRKGRSNYRSVLSDWRLTTHPLPPPACVADRPAGARSCRIRRENDKTRRALRPERQFRTRAANAKFRADGAPTAIASGRSGFRAIAVFPWRARNSEIALTAKSAFRVWTVDGSNALGAGDDAVLGLAVWVRAVQNLAPDVGVGCIDRRRGRLGLGRRSQR